MPALDMPRQILRDRDDDRAFDEHGCVVLRGVLPQDVLTEVDDCLAANRDSSARGWHYSLQTGSSARRWAIHGVLRELFANHLEPLLHDHQMLVGAAVCKESDDESAVPVHNDWSFVDEARFASLNLWAPLCATTAHNGALAVARGSHRLPSTIRGPLVVNPIQYTPEQAARYLTTFEMDAGDVLVFQHRMLHASAINRSGVARAAFSMSAVPLEARPVQYVGVPSRPGTVLEVDADERFYLDCHIDPRGTDDAALPPEYATREIEYDPVVIDGDDLARACGPRRRSGLGKRLAARLRSSAGT